MRIVYSKSLLWLSTYITSVEKIIPRIKKLTDIRVIRSSVTKRDRMYGELRQYEDGTFTMKLRKSYQHLDFHPLTVTIKKLSKIDILHNLAHELAHLYHWDHTPEHKILENQLLTVFMYKLKQNDYISEEKDK